MEERLLPLRIGIVVPDDVVAAGASPCACIMERRHTERHVMNARTTGLEKPREKTVTAGGLEDLDPAAALESPLSEAISWRRSAVRGCAAELAHEDRGCVGHARHGDRDVIEENSGHGESILAKLAHAGKSREERNDAGKHGGALPDAAGDRESRAPE